MHHSKLDNVIWHSLQGPHHVLAKSLGELSWYPPEVAPFFAVPAADVVPDLHGASEHGWRAPAYVTGIVPDVLPEGWRYSSRSQILQMLPADLEIPAIDEHDIVELGDGDRPKMLALAQAAFPDFFRKRTAELGEYLGVFAGASLIAMAGERLALDGMQEISGVCTHPDFVGRGYARRLTLALMHRHRRRGVASFLHVSEGNTAARRLYESMGLVVRASLTMGKVERENPT
jgi:ribosomal protein S18 acetylase RimI-like enzyme